MIGGAAWLWVAAALASPPAPCGAAVVEAPAQALLVAINHERLRAGRATLRLDAALCAVAAERIQTLLGRRSLDADEAAIAEVSRRLFAHHYRAERWSEQPVLRRGGALAVLEGWRRLDPERAARTLAADVADFGAASASFEGLPLTLLLFALPRHEAFLREARAMGSLAALRTALVAAANAERRRAGLAPLSRREELDAAAQAHALDLVARDYYDHTTPEGAGVLERLRREGFRARLAAENLARGPFSPADAVARWMLSSGHRANLLSPRVDLVGAGVVLDDRPEKEQFTFVLDFAAASP